MAGQDGITGFTVRFRHEGREWSLDVSRTGEYRLFRDNHEYVVGDEERVARYLVEQERFPKTIDEVRQTFGKYYALIGAPAPTQYCRIYCGGIPLVSPYKFVTVDKTVIVHGSLSFLMAIRHAEMMNKLHGGEIHVEYL